MMLVASMGFYGLGLWMGRAGLARLSPPSVPQEKANFSTRDPRSDLDFINSGTAKNPALVSETAPADPGANGNSGTRPRPGPPVFSVQVAVFERRQDAGPLLDALLARGYAARIVAASDNLGDARFLVCVGSYEDRAEAEVTAGRLAGIGFSGSQVTTSLGARE
ncbi:MAG: SPOR domain-containing protein [Acidobacteria bacterium]|nr:SPOR domain-containing protein [Acidobacteriota bacterium]